MKKSMLLFILLSACLPICCSVSEGDKRPNIVLILIDDMDWKDFGEAGSTYYEAGLCIGFLTTLLRGAEWVASGEFAQHLLASFSKISELKIRESLKTELIKFID